MMDYVKLNATVISSLDADNAVSKFRYVMDGLLNNKAMLIVLISFCKLLFDSSILIIFILLFFLIVLLLLRLFKFEFIVLLLLVLTKRPFCNVLFCSLDFSFEYVLFDFSKDELKLRLLDNKFVILVCCVSTIDEPKEFNVCSLLNVSIIKLLFLFNVNFSFVFDILL